ncbi:MAG: peptide deformylase [Oscillospiraceae bacterium]|jgi:peptide deformylase|nr:peptide deformylase [Oscillospiraceae bacterium]
MAIRNILTDDDPTLYKSSRVVTNFDKRLHTLIDDMAETLQKAEGAGIAAPQVGVLRRVCVVDVDEGEKPIELVNPEIISVKGEQVGREGCLSVPGVVGIVKRPMSVTVRAQNRNGGFFTVTGEELKARALCHEIEHLDGILYTDKVIRFLSKEEIENEE